jgi:hypothetical protein
MRTIRTPENEQTFIETLEDTCNVREACRVSEIARTAVYQWRKDDAAFAKRWEDALAIGADSLEEEAVRRAREGVDEPVFYKGDICGAVRKYSDTLLIFLLKGAKPSKYREQLSVEHSGSVELASRLSKALADE